MATWLRNHVRRCLAAILLLTNTASFADPPSIELFARDAIAATDAEMIAQSPITYVDRITAAAMLIHGEEDQHTPLSQGQAMKLALEQRQKPVEWLVRP